jgi:hypothetical protein
LQSLTLAWDAVPSPFIAGYKVHYGLRSRGYAEHVDIGTNTVVRLEDLEDGTLYFFAVTAYDAYQNESDYSQEILHITPGTNDVSPYAQVARQPEVRAVALGHPVTLSVGATGGGTLSYQWRKDGVNIPGGTSSNLTLSAADAASQGRYSVEVRNELGSIISREIPLRVIIPPRLESVKYANDGIATLSFGNADGSPVTPLQVFRFGVEAAATPRSTETWEPVTNAWLFENGSLVLEDPDSTSMSQRYYRSVDHASPVGALRLMMPERMGGGGVRLRVQPEGLGRALSPTEAQSVRIEANVNPGSPDSWMPIAQTARLVGEEVVVEDADAAVRSKCFYRAVAPAAGFPSVRLQAASSAPGRSFRLRLGRADGLPLAASEVYNYEVWVKPDPYAASGWQLLTNAMSLQAGKLIVRDAASDGASMRFYRIYAR